SDHDTVALSARLSSPCSAPPPVILSVAKDLLFNGAARGEVLPSGSGALDQSVGCAGRRAGPPPTHRSEGARAARAAARLRSRLRPVPPRPPDALVQCLQNCPEPERSASPRARHGSTQTADPSLCSG